MQTNLSRAVALCLGACLAWSCGGGGDSIDDTGNPGVAAPNGGRGGAAGNVGGAAASPSATGATGTTPGAPATTAGAAATTPSTATTTPGAAATTPGAAATTPAATPTAPAAGATTAPAASTAAATIVPLYTNPADPSWNAVIAAKAAHPKVGVIAVVNPGNGPGGAVAAGYASGIARLNAAGIKVVGYVATGYAVNSPVAVKADIDRWRTFYPGQIGGIFFDEQSNRAGDVPYYRDLSQYAKAQGMPFTIGNPGTDTAESYIGALDVMLIYESSGLPSASQMGGWHANHAPSNFGVIPYATQLDATFVRNARRSVQYIYLQNDTLPNPWDSVPGYFSDLLAALE